jgi:hypothetical protein
MMSAKKLAKSDMREHPCAYCDAHIPADSPRSRFCTDRCAQAHYRNIRRGDAPRAAPRKPGRKPKSGQSGLVHQNVNGKVSLPDGRRGRYGAAIAGARDGDMEAVAVLEKVGARVWIP